MFCYKACCNRSPITTRFHTGLGSDFHEGIAKVKLLNKHTLHLDFQPDHPTEGAPSIGAE